jgi:SAM-dependent methyltransferase
MGPTSATAASPLFRVVPASARRILHVGCGNGILGAALKMQEPDRLVFGIERAPATAAQAAGCLDEVFRIDADLADPQLEPGSLDCILYGGVLGRLADAEAVLRRHRRFLRPGGSVYCYVRNAQHHSLFTALSTGDFPLAPGCAPLDVPRRYFTRASIIKLLLDCGLTPSLLEVLTRPCRPKWWEAIQPLLRLHRLDPERARRFFDTYRFLFRGEVTSAHLSERPALVEVDHRSERPLTFVCCVSDDAILHGNLLASPCFRPGSPHEIMLQHGCRSAAEGLNEGIRRARHEWVVCLHQDAYLPAGWPTRFVQQVENAQRVLGPIGVCGVMGASGEGAGRRWQAHIVHQDRPLFFGPLPAVVETLDELLLAFPRGTPLRLDPSLGFHLYGSDVCLASRCLGLHAVAVDALCYHNMRSNTYPPEFAASAATFVRKWAAELPVVTPCVMIGRDGKIAYR